MACEDCEDASFTHFYAWCFREKNQKNHGRAQPPEFSEVRGTSVLGGCRLLHQVSQTRAGQSAGGIVFFLAESLVISP